MKATGETSKLAHLFVLKPFVPTRVHTIILKENGSAANFQEDRHYETTDQTTEMTGVGWGRTATTLGPLTVTVPAHAGQFIWTGTDYRRANTMAQPK